MTTKTFKRFENKYLLTREQYKAIMQYIPQYMCADEYNQNGGCYTIHNIYYDTEKNDIIRNSLEKPYYKEKLRLRSYQVPASSKEIVFMELKKKIGGVVSKRRASMTLAEGIRFVRTGSRPNVIGYTNHLVVEEIAQFLNTHEVVPKTVICYKRMAFFGMEDKEFRVTFDHDIRTRRSQISLEAGSFGEQLLEDETYLMEVKIIGAIPLWLARILTEEKVYSTGFSKYGTEYKKYCANFESEGRRVYA